MIVRLEARHRSSLVTLLDATREFDPDEKKVALELIDAGIDAVIKRGACDSGEDDYRFWIDEEDSSARGYICFGRTPMTRATYDLYWICAHPAHRGAGIGRSLIQKMEDEIKREGATLVRVETAGTDEYAATRAFYDRIGYEVIATIRDFYWRGNDLIIYGRYF